MSGETEKNISSWTIASLKEHFEQRFTDQSKAVDAALTAAKQAVEKEEQNSEKWRQSANEWRGSMLDRETKFAARTEVDAELKAVRSELHVIKEDVGRMRIELMKEISSLRESRSVGEGEKGGKLSQQQLLFALLAAAGILFGVFMAIQK